MIYPKKLSSKKGEILLKIFLYASVILGIVLVIINKLTAPNIHWSALANCGIIYIWLTVFYSIKRNANIAGHVLMQTIAISSSLLYIDNRIGFMGWSINIGIPIILIITNATMLILTIITCKNYIKYAIYQLMIVIISFASIWLIWYRITGLKILSNIAIAISIINFLISLILCFKDIKEVFTRNFHM